MKKNKSKIKLICALLVAAMLLSALGSAGASGGFYIDDSLFSEYEKDHVTTWYWRPGLPPTAKDGTKYPILLTWDNDKYFFNANESFYNTEARYSNLVPIANTLPLYGQSNPNLAIGLDNGFYPYSWIGSGGWVGYTNMFPYGYMHGYYKPQNYFGASADGLTAKLPFNLEAIAETGSGISLDMPDLPYVVGRGQETKDDYERYFYYIGLDVPENLNNRYVRADHPYAWLASDYIWTEQYTAQDPLLYAGIRCFFNWCFEPFFTDSLTDFSRIYFRDRTDVFQEGENGEIAEWEPETWVFERKKSGSSPYPEYNYTISNGSFLDLVSSGEMGHIGYDFETWLDAIGQMGDRANCGLRWDGSNFIMQGNIKNFYIPQAQDQHRRFKCYYATPVLMDIIHTSFEVENGQVANLDGPIIIGSNCTITVKEGGTLTITAKTEANGVDLGWVMNNGKIIVEEGGTLYIQKGACLNKYNNKSSSGGGIICRGLCIVDEDAKLCGGGVDGLQFLDGSHVVNYGAIISENFKVVNDHTIENRGDNAFIFHGKGNGVVGSGYSLFVGKVTKDDYPERGTVLETVEDSIAPNGIYSW